MARSSPPRHRRRAVIVAGASGFALVVATGLASVSVLARPAGADPSVTLSASSADPGDTVLVTLTGWSGGAVTVSVCGNEAQRGSQDCELRSAKGAGPFRGARPEVIELRVEKPPATCPCVVRVASRSSDVVVVVPFVVNGVATGPVVGSARPGPPLNVTAGFARASSSLGDRLRSSFGGRTTRTLEVAIENTSGEPVQVSLSAGVGRDRQGGEPLDVPQLEPLPPGEIRQFTIPVLLSAPSFGRYVVSGTVFVPYGSIRFESSTSTTPGLLIAAGFALALVTVVRRVRKGRRRVGARRQPRSIPSRAPPVPILDGYVPQRYISVQNQPLVVTAPAPAPARAPARAPGPVARRVSPPAGGLFESRRGMVASVAATAALAAVALAAAMPSGGTGAAGTATSTTTAPGKAPAAGGDPSGAGGQDAGSTPSTTTTGPGETPPDQPTGGDGQATSTATPAIPVAIEVAGTTGLVDGSEVTVRVIADEGSSIFGFEVFLCKAGVTFELDAEVRPDDTGNCAAEPLSAGTDRYQEVRASPPYEVAETTFRVGVGTDSYAMSDGTPVSITCGPGHPCQLVLKVQYPDGYGFRAYPLEFA